MEDHQNEKLNNPRKSPISYSETSHSLRLSDIDSLSTISMPIQANEIQNAKAHYQSMFQEDPTKKNALQFNTPQKWSDYYLLVDGRIVTTQEIMQLILTASFNDGLVARSESDKARGKLVAIRPVQFSEYCWAGAFLQCLQEVNLVELSADIILDSWSETNR